ncbi:MAG: hypothetical protein AAF739_01440 [Pseudomonadota bacterium]
MNSIARRVAAITIVGACGFYPQILSADGFTGEQFLEWSDAAQDSYIQTSVTMAAILATQTNKPSGDCLTDWYFEPAANRAERHNSIKQTIARNGEHHPSSVIYLILEEACGPFAIDPS